MNTSNPNDHFYTDKRVAVKRRYDLKVRGVRSTVTKFRTDRGVFYRLRVHKD